MPDPKHNHKLNGVHKAFILRCLALGFGPQDVVDFVEDEFDIKLDRSNIAYYKREYPDEIIALKEELTKDIELIPFARKLDRVAYLDRAARRLFKRRNWSEFRATLKQIAEETGGIVQRTELTGKNGGPFDVRISIDGQGLDNDQPGD
jgi:hypothetical protein